MISLRKRRGANPKESREAEDEPRGRDHGCGSRLAPQIRKMSMLLPEKWQLQVPINLLTFFIQGDRVFLAISLSGELDGRGCEQYVHFLVYLAKHGKRKQIWLLHPS